MYKIQANASGTRSIEVSDTHLETIKRYALLKNLIDSNGIIDEPVLDKLKFNCRSILESQAEVDRNLMDLCLDVIYNNYMKAFGLHNLVLLFVEWTGCRQQEERGEKE
ncbi:MAG: hypothetical protein PUH24_04765 [Prevotellaceae bacterium]|nr:hypothetical protein [Prevotella sp.]MDD7257574.1 hypothetical protein [Prevotellaceae bacterium]MDY6130951.1 hypothetical protein [Prevotella sp.]